MIVILNRGLIIESAIIAELNRYFDTLALGDIYKNFHTKITNSHPFADIYFHGTENASDHFPAVVVTSTNSYKTPELQNVIPQTSGISLEKEDFLAITDKDELGKAGISTVIGEKTRKTIEKHFKTHQFLYGIHTPERKTDSISIEIWAENNQLKNELFEHTRLFIGANLINFLNNDYDNYDISMNDASIREERSNNFNLDFDTILSGGHISFEIDYSIDQLLLDTEIENIGRDLIIKVVNHIKGNENIKEESYV